MVFGADEFCGSVQGQTYDEAVLVRNFGSNAEGGPLLGDVFNLQGPVFAAESGEVVFKHNETDGASRLPSPLGAWIVLEHDNGLLSVYSRMEDTKAPLPDKIEKGALLAQAGVSGWSSGEGFSFSIFDKKEKRWVNPDIVIDTHLDDRRPPVIQSVRLRNSDGVVFDADSPRVLRQGRYSIDVQTYDLRGSAQTSQLMPHRIISSVNGIETGSLTIETFSARDGVLMLFRGGLISANEVYGPYPLIEAGEVWLNRGSAKLEIIVQDIAGNSRSANYRLNIE
ncbi:hypothetical protein FACS1894190_18130 [Spirochaetia bacterium]|nr:hypothetical protein FACS1894190_18130 [Spirochaetia bacterium]